MSWTPGFSVPAPGPSDADIPEQIARDSEVAAAIAAQAAADSDTYVSLAQRGAANGVATLDSNTLVPVAQLPLSSTNITILADRAPTGSDGIDGDGWIDASTLPPTVYGPKAAGAWPSAEHNLLDLLGWPSGVEASMPRYSAVSNTVSTATTNMRLVYFTAQRAVARTNMVIYSGATAAGATPTIVRGGLYSVAANGDLTLIRSTTNDTAVFAATNTAYTKALDSSWTPTVGARYAAAILVVTAATAPTLTGHVVGSGVNAISARAPRLTGVVTGQSNLPSSVSAGSVADLGNCPYVEFS